VQPIIKSRVVGAAAPRGGGGAAALRTAGRVVTHPAMNWRRGTARSLRSLSLALVLGALGSAGCKQSEGDRCEVDNDCQAGLTCENPQGTSGHCIAPMTVTPTPDAGPKLDAQPQAGPDAARDAPVPDAAVEAHPADAPPDQSALDGGADAAGDAHVDGAGG
jgi:hypothetical protein